MCLHLSSATSALTEKCFRSDRSMIQYLMRKYSPCFENPLDPECLPSEIEKKATLAYIKRSPEYESSRTLRGTLAYP
ncbi:unnamed protein product [Rodentolepis nana]|uniref:Dimer_Tnp_hAT domain-containing protein n=1 Tax=Rodentolepis nana TaxID=102285 RepID=A0A0R3T4H4_RODNA|nr:unnamed protein product [Rodentolepis nana]